MTEWQPIETAPRQPVEDNCSFGPMILLTSVYGHIAVGYWGKGLGYDVGWVNPNDHFPMSYWNEFTHWMPLPPPPTAIAEDA